MKMIAVDDRTYVNVDSITRINVTGPHRSYSSNEQYYDVNIYLADEQYAKTIKRCENKNEAVWYAAHVARACADGTLIVP